MIKLMYNCLRINHNIRDRFLNLGNQLHRTSYLVWLANSNSSISRSQLSWPPKASLTNSYPLLGSPQTDTLLPSIVKLLLECFHSSWDEQVLKSRYYILFTLFPAQYTTIASSLKQKQPEWTKESPEEQ